MSSPLASTSFAQKLTTTCSAFVLPHIVHAVHMHKHVQRSQVGLVFRDIDVNTDHNKIHFWLHYFFIFALYVVSGHLWLVSYPHAINLVVLVITMFFSVVCFHYLWLFSYESICEHLVVVILKLYRPFECQYEKYNKICFLWFIWTE